MHFLLPILKWIVAMTTLITVYSKFIHSPLPTIVPQNLTESYDPNLAWINSIENLNLEVSRRLNNDFADTSKLVNCIDDILRERFYHSYSEYTFQDNWICSVASKFLGWGLVCPVVEDDILKYPMAACSQQSLVFQKILRFHQIPFSTVRFNDTNTNPGGHYAVSAHYSGSWHFFDSNIEPTKLNLNPSIYQLIDENKLEKMYASTSLEPGWMSRKIHDNLIHRDTKINVEGAQNMKKFHVVINFLSSWLWLLLLTIYAAIALNTKNKTQ
jgi:hypothetical protein